MEVLFLLSFKIVSFSLNIRNVMCVRECIHIYLCTHMNGCMCKSEHFICVNKLMASWVIKRLAAHVSLGVSVISWHHAQQTDSCSDKSASGNGCVATIWLLQLQQPNSHSSGWYQLMEVSGCYCQYAVTSVKFSSRYMGCEWLCGLITTLNWHAATLWSSTRDHRGADCVNLQAEGIVLNRF